jgi:hypothetical protein
VDPHLRGDGWEVGPEARHHRFAEKGVLGVGELRVVGEEALGAPARQLEELNVVGQPGDPELG